MIRDVIFLQRRKKTQKCFGTNVLFQGPNICNSSPNEDVTLSETFSYFKTRALILYHWDERDWLEQGYSTTLDVSYTQKWLPALQGISCKLKF